MSLSVGFATYLQQNDLTKIGRAELIRKKVEALAIRFNGEEGSKNNTIAAGFIRIVDDELESRRSKTSIFVAVVAAISAFISAVALVVQIIVSQGHP